MTKSNPDGPLRLPPAPTTAARRTAVQSLAGHTTAANWLPDTEGAWPALDDVRGEQLRLRGQVSEQLAELDALAARFAAEDREHADALRQAHRDGSPAEVADDRTAPAQRAAEHALISERLWAGLEVLAEHAEHVVATVREHEDEWLGDLRGRLAGAQDKRRQAEALLAEARSEEWQVHRLGQWLMTTADDTTFGRQPAPERVPVPASFQLPEHALARPWHRVTQGAAA